VFKAHRLCVSLNSRVESNKEGEEGCLPALPCVIALPLPSEEGTTQVLNLNAKARFWPGLSYKCRIRSTADRILGRRNNERKKLGFRVEGLGFRVYG